VSFLAKNKKSPGQLCAAGRSSRHAYYTRPGLHAAATIEVEIFLKTKFAYARFLLSAEANKLAWSLKVES
jgi:hypothetical protein